MNRNTIIDYIGRLRTKPEHVRRRIAVGTAVGTTGVIAAVWLFILASSGTLLVSPVPSAANSAVLAAGTSQVQAVTAQTKSGFQQLLGAVGFASATTAPPSLHIVDTATSSDDSSEQPTDQSPTGGNQTVIPF
jgi:hypothetical protein